MNSARITCLGKRQGFFLDECVSPAPLEPVLLPVTARDRKEEAKLYPALIAWLTAKGFKAKDTSTAKRGGQWGNPDVAGVRTYDTLGQFEIELLTIKTKQSVDNWMINIFEAVSHRRFANRAYFAYAVSDANSDKLPRDLHYYSELFKVGVLAIEMPDEMFLDFHDGKLKEIDSRQIVIRELFPAPYNPVQQRYQSEFFEKRNITSKEGIYTWGAQ